MERGLWKKKKREKKDKTGKYNKTKTNMQTFQRETSYNKKKHNCKKYASQMHTIKSKKTLISWGKKKLLTKEEMS